MTSAAQRDFVEVQRLAQERVDLLHDMLNERLQLKDRWISDRFDEVDKRLVVAVSSLEKEVKDLHELMCTEIEAHKQWSQMRFDMGARRFDDYVAANAERGRLVIEGHLELHRIADNSLNAYKDSIQQRIEQMVKVIETLREERGLFVLRDSHDAQIDSMEKTVLALEKSLNERIDASIRQTKESVDNRIQSNLDRIVKLEQNLQVMNARNQQSIIALGILLTLVEIIVRFYNS
jgi:hypothetical protein